MQVKTLLTVLFIDSLYCIDLSSCIAASLFNKLTYDAAYYYAPALGGGNHSLLSKLWGALSDTAIRPSVSPVAQLPRL